MIHEERPNSRGLGSLVKLSSDLKVDSPDVAEETRTELLEKLRLDSTRRAHLLEQHRAESNMEDSRRHSRIHKRPGYEAMRERHEHLKDVDEWFRSLDVDHTNTVDAHELIGPFTVLGMAKTRADVEDLAEQIELHDSDGIKGLSIEEFRAFVATHGLRPEELRSRASAAVKPKRAPSTSGDKAAAKRAEELRLHELDLRTQILMNRRGQVMEALMAHATTSTEPDVKRCRELQGTLRTLVKHKEWSDRITGPLGDEDRERAATARRTAQLEATFPQRLLFELDRRDKAKAHTTCSPQRSRASRTIRQVLGGSGRPAKLVFGGGEKYVSRYATSKSAVNVGGKLEKQDDKRKELVSRAFYGHRKADRSGTVGVPLYRPGSPFPVLIHASTRKPEDVHLPAQSRKSLLLAAAHRRPVTAF